MEGVIRLTADRHCPVNHFTERKALRPWVTAELLELLKELDDLYRLAKKSSSDQSWKLARKAQNLCKTAVKHAKDTYVKAQLSVLEGDPRRFWQAINSIWSTRDSDRPLISLFDPQSGSLMDSSIVPEAFNEHLTGVGRRLSDRFVHPHIWLLLVRSLSNLNIIKSRKLKFVS